MATFPVGDFKVKVKGSDSHTLSGKLTLSTTNGTNGATFKTQDDTSTLSWTANSSNQGVIGWTYTDNQDHKHTFVNGVYTPGNPDYNKGSFSGGTVNTDDTPAGSANDSWDASASGPGDDEPLADRDYAVGAKSD